MRFFTQFSNAQRFTANIFDHRNTLDDLRQQSKFLLGQESGLTNAG
jgi:hypothetical protein